MFLFLNYIYNKALNHSRWTLLLFFVLSIAFLYQATSLKKNIVIKDQIDKSSPDYQRLTILEENFEKYYRVPILFTGDVANNQKVCKTLLWLENRVINDPNLITINSPFHIRYADSKSDSLHYPTLLPLDCHEIKRVDYKILDSTPWKDIFTSSRSKNNIIFEILLQKNDVTQQKKKFNAKIISNLENDLKLFLYKNEINFNFHLLSWASNRRYVHEGIIHMSILNIILCVIIVVLFRIFFGSFKSSLLVLVTLTMMGIFLYGTMSLFNIPIDMLNSGIFLLLAISALQDYIFILAKMYYQNISFKQSTSELLAPSFFTSLTTVIGFGSLYLSDIVILQRFGLCAAFGAIIEWILTFLFLPALVEKFKSFQNLVIKERSFFTTHLKSVTTNTIPKYVSISLLLVFLTGSLAVLKPNIYEEPFAIFPDDHSFTQGLKKLTKTREWTTTFDIIFTNQDPVFQEKVLSQIQKNDHIIKTISILDIINFLTKNTSPNRSELILRDFKMTPLYERFRNDIYSRAILYLTKNEVSLVSKLKREIEALCNDGKDCFPTGNLIAYTEFGEKIPRALIKSFGTSLLLVSLVILFLVKVNNAGYPTTVILSSMWGPFACLTLMKLLDMPINYITCMFASIIVGITGDNAIQFIFAKKENSLDRGISNIGGGSIIVFLITTFSSMIFLFGYFKFSKDFGVILILGSLLSLVGDIWILKSLIGRRT